MAGPVSVSFRFYGEAQVDRTINRIVDDVTDAREAWEVITESFVRAERKQFRSQGAYGSAGWPALSPRYAAWKAIHFPGKPILERTGHLKKTLTERPLGIEVLEPRFMVIGSPDKVGEYHQHGNARLPRRRPVEFPESLRREWVKIIQRFIITGHARARAGGSNKIR